MKSRPNSNFIPSATSDNWIYVIDNCSNSTDSKLKERFSEEPPRIAAEDPKDLEDYEFYNFEDSKIGESWMIGNDSDIYANAYIGGHLMCQENIIVPRSLKNKEEIVKPVEVIGRWAYGTCGDPNWGFETKTVFVTKQVKVIKYYGFGSMFNVENFRIEDGSVLELIEYKAMDYIGFSTGQNDANKRGTLTLPSTLSSVSNDGIYDCNIFKEIIYCGIHSLLNSCELFNGSEELEATKVKVTNQYSEKTIFGQTPLYDSPTEVEGNCSRMELQPPLGFKVVEVEGGCEVIGWRRGEERCPDTNLTIPEIVDNLTVVAIRERAFENCTTSGSIVLPQTLRRIGAKAFAGTENVTDVIFLGTKFLSEIGEAVFCRCGARTIIIRADST